MHSLSLTNCEINLAPQGRSKPGCGERPSELIRLINMLHATFILFAFASVTLVSCTSLPISPAAAPSLEVSQVQSHRWEVIVRLHDEAVTGDSVRCGIYRVDREANEVGGRLADISLNRTDESGEFIGIYSNGKEFPHGTKVVAIYQPSRRGLSIRASTMMFYH
jgi:hypothetical protein